MPTPVPSFDHLPQRWRSGDARIVLAALAASGLTAAEFARRTGITAKRLSRWGLQLIEPAAKRCGPGRPRTTVSPARLVELVPSVGAARVEAPPSAPASLAAIEVRSPDGWHLRVPGERLGDLVAALAVRAC